MSEWRKSGGKRNYIDSVDKAITTGPVKCAILKISDLRAVASVPGVQSEFNWHPSTGAHDSFGNWDISIWNYESLHAGTDYLHQKFQNASLPYASSLSPKSTEGYTPTASIRLPIGFTEDGEANYWWFFTFQYNDDDQKYNMLSAPTSWNDENHSYYGLYDTKPNAMDYTTGAWYNNFREWAPSEAGRYAPAFYVIIDDEHPGDDLYIGWILDDEEATFVRFGGYRLLDMPSHTGTLPTTEVDVRFGPESRPEGYPDDEPEGQFDFSSTSIAFPDEPDVSVSDMGFMNVYKVTKNSLEGLLEEIYPDLEPIPEPSDLGEAMIWVGKQIERLTANFMNSGLQKYIVDCHVIPCPINGGTIEAIQVGFRSMHKNGYKLSNDYAEFDCGSVSLKQTYFNFMDLGTEVQLYLPFVGFVPIRPELVLGGKVHVKYRFNILDGTFVCGVSCTSRFSDLKESLIGNYSGCCCVHMPLTSSDYSSIVSGLVGTIGGVMAGGPAGLAVSAASAAHSLSTGGGFSMSNGYNASSGFLGKRRPYLMISRPKASFSASYPSEVGMPLNVTYKLGNLIGSGKTICENPHIDFECSEYEREELKKILTSGIIL